MNEVKNVIGLLSKHLNFLLGVETKPEHFRLAKFNKTDDNVVTLFWDLINKFANKSYTNDKISNAKYYMKLQKYDSLPFFALPNDGNGGSRELLLAVGYLIAKNVLNAIVFEEIRKSPFGKQQTDNDESNPMKCENGMQNLPEIKVRSTKDAENLSQWIRGKIVYNNKLTFEYKSSSEKMVKKLNDSMRENYTETELIAIHDRKAGELFMNESSRIVKVMANHEKWLKNANTFWDWMNSVLKEREKSCEDLNLDNAKAFEESIQTFKCQEQIL